jgi:hypothetical protein
MREQPHYKNLLTLEFFKKYYEQERMSYHKISKMLKKQGYNIHYSTIFSYARKLGIGRNSLEARQNWDTRMLDYSVSFIKEPTIEAIDGFLLGDGSLGSTGSPKSHAARLGCSVEYEEFSRYLMSFFSDYEGRVTKVKDARMKQGFYWGGRSKSHPDLYDQYLRWYPEDENGHRTKQPPDDVRITRKSVVLWFLGDGTCIIRNNTIVVRLSTDSFAFDKVEMLVDRLKEKNINCKRTSENRIRIMAKGIPAFYNFIGHKSPISCYNYKWDRVPKFRFESKRMSEVAEELGVNYSRLSYFVKCKRIPCYRISEKGRPRFLPEHIQIAKNLILEGELY